MLTKIHVTQKNIDEGKSHSSFNCPIAMSLHDLGYKHVKIDTKQVEISFIRYPAFGYNYSDRIISNLPESAQEFIRKFDNFELEDKPKPFNFMLQLP